MKKGIDAVIKTYFLSVMFLMYYFITQETSVGGIGITLRHVFALLLIVSAFVYFLFSPDIARGAVTVKSSLVFAVPLAITLVSSMLVWVIEKSAASTIARGLSSSIIYMNVISCSLAAGSVLYVFGEYGIWFNLAAIVASNLVMIFQIILSDGAGTFFLEFVRLVATFASDTGETIVKAEIHELAFCLGAYIIYMLIKPKKKVWFWVLFALACFCFIAALKRIAVIAIFAAVSIRLLLLLPGIISQKAVSRTANGMMILCILLLVGYIYIISADAFTYLEKAGIDTSGRANIYSYVKDFYTFSPLFPGRGIGFLTYQLYEKTSIGVSSVHNDFLQFYIDLGFWGYILWLISMTFLRTMYFGKNDADTAAVTAALTVYLLIVSSTDNTMNYPLVTTVMGVLIMGNGFVKKVEAQQKYFESRPV